MAALDPQHTLTDNDRLLVALFLAFLIHIMLILGIRFTIPAPPSKNSRSIDVTLVETPAKKAPKEAKFLAQQNQVGTGVKAKKPEPPAQRIASQGNSSKFDQADEEEQEEAEPEARQKVVIQKRSEAKQAVEKKREDKREKEYRPRLTAESLQQQIAQYGAEIREKEESADQTKIKYASSVSAHKYVAAQYVKDWERKVERTGNMNYPAIAAKKNFSGTLTMDVGIKSDGTIYSMRVSRSSGYPALDEAAKRIVRMSAPFPPLPSDMLKEVNVLVITRKWKFSDESGMTTP